MQSVEIVHNRVKNGIELYFKKPLSLKEADHLKQSGFEQAFQQPLKWWAKQHPAFIHFAEALKVAILKQTPITDVLLQPSFTPSQENIDLNKFSFVTLKGDSFNPESYVIFDPYKVVAHAVATRFGNNKYGPQLKEVQVLPRKQKNLARTHLKNGYVITGQKEPVPQEIDPETGLKYLDQRANIYGVYTQKTAEGYYEEVEIPFPKSLKFRAAIKLAQGSDNQYRYGTRLENLTGSFAGHHSAPSVHDKAYPTREAALESALKYLYAHSDTPVPARKYLQEFALSQGIHLLHKPLANQPKANITSLEDRLERIDKLYDAEKYEVAAIELSPLLDDVAAGYHLEAFTRILELYLDKKIAAYMRKTNWSGLSAVVLSPFFRNALTQNLWELLPDPFKDAKLPSVVKWNASPADEGLQKLVADFTGNDSINRNTLGVHFDENGIAATDSIKLLFLPDTTHQERGLFCMTAECFEAITSQKGKGTGLTPADQEKLEKFRTEARFPDYLSVIPRSWNRVLTIDCAGLLSFIQAQQKCKLLSPLNPVRVKINSQFVGIKPDLLKRVLRVLLSLGEREIDIGFTEPLKPLVFAGKGKIPQTPELRVPFVLAMPFALAEESEKELSGRGHLYYDLELSRALTTGISTPSGDNPQDLQKTPKGHPGDNPQLPELPSDMSLSEWLRRLGFTRLFTAEEALNKPMLVSDLHHRWQDAYAHFHKQYEEPAIQQIQDWRSELEGLQKDKTPTGKAASKELKERIDLKQEEIQLLKVRLEEENLRFQEAFLQLLQQKAEQIGFRIAQENERSSFDAEMAEGFFNERMAEAYYRQSIPQAAEVLIHDFFRADPEAAHTPELLPQPATEPEAGPSGSDYLDLVVAHIHDMFSEGQRPTKGQIEKLGSQLQIPNRGLLWEAVELAWLLWYRMIYRQNNPFEIRLHQMIRFWQNLQPTYAYSDSSKELYRQYSTPCPIGAIVAQYTGMDSAQKIFEPSAGNGLFLVGADPQKTHVNEIDASRRASLEFQGYAHITRYNAAEAFPPEMTGTFDVIVTNPPFSKWEEEEFDKVRIVQKYFGGQVGLKQLRLEHLMAGLALDTLKDEGRAAIIIMGHIYFDTNGYIAKYRGFFNWLYRHYYVDDVINLNGFKLYNKQGAIEKTMLILIRGRKQVPTGVAPLQNQAPWLDNVVDSFDQLWERVRPHIYYSTETIIQQLQIELIEV